MKFFFSSDDSLLKTNPRSTSNKIFWRNAIDPDTLNSWRILRGDYIANGTETVFMIGDFYGDMVDDNENNVVARKTGALNYYYYVDEVCLVPKNNSANPDIAPGKKLVSQNILFETNKSDLKAESFPILNKILSALEAQPNMKVEIDGHTDNVGAIATNQKLSEDRAKAVADFFIENGIDASRITWKGFGSSKPISDDNDKNRRVEFIFSE